MTFTLGSVSPRCWGNGKTFSHRIGAVFSSIWGEWACAAHMGRLLAHHQPTSRRHCPHHIGRPRKPSSLCSPRWGTIVLIGSRCWMVCVLDRWIFTTWTLVCPRTVGSFSLLRLGRDTSAQKCCGLVLHRHSRLSCVRNRARLLDFPSWPCHLRPSHTSLPNFSACFFSGGRCGRPLDVLGHHRESWQVPASPPTYSFGTWTCQSHVTMVDDWKSWLTGFHCSISSSLTPHGEFCDLTH